MASAHKGDLSKPVKIALNLIKVDHALQPRVTMEDEESVAHWNRMAQSYIDGIEPPPSIHVFWDGKFYWLVDGFHRYKAMWSIRRLKAKFQQISCIVHEGTRQEAIVYAAQANLDDRSKLMTNLDRKKAMWMLLDIEEWREKSSAQLGKILGISDSKTARKYWLEYFEARQLPVPEMAKDATGKLRPILTNRRGGNKPKISPRGKNYGYSASVNGKKIYLGGDLEKAKTILAETIQHSCEQKAKGTYDSQGQLGNALVALGICWKLAYSQSISGVSGLHGMNIQGIAVTSDSFRDKFQEIKAIGQAVCCKAHIGADRAVVLCPVEKGRPEVLELGRKAGVEFMTIEDFVASLKPGGSPDA